MLKVFVTTLLFATAASAAPLACVDLFTTSPLISQTSAQDLQSAYPLLAPSIYAGRKDWVNYFEVSLSEIHQAQVAMDLDLLRENQIFQFLAGQPAETLKLAGRDVSVKSDGTHITFSWSNVLGATDHLVVQEAPAPAANSVAAKAAAYQQQFLLFPRSTEIYRAYLQAKLAARTDLKLNGKAIGILDDLRAMQNALSLQRTLGLLPLDHLPALFSQLEDAVRTSNGSEHEWGSETVRLNTTGSTGFVYNDQSLELHVSHDLSQDVVTLSGTLRDAVQPKTMFPRFELEIRSGVVKIISGAEAVTYGQGRIARDLQSMFDELVPSYKDLITPQTVVK